MGVGPTQYGKYSLISAQASLKFEAVLLAPCCCAAPCGGVAMTNPGFLDAGSLGSLLMGC